jgi:hypothetical protein
MEVKRERRGEERRGEERRGEVSYIELHYVRQVWVNIRGVCVCVCRDIRQQPIEGTCLVI